MKLIFESLNELDIKKHELDSITEGFSETYEKGKKYVVDAIKRMIAYIRALISKLMKRKSKDETFESLDISKLKSPNDIFSKLNNNNETANVKPMNKSEMVKHILKDCVNYNFDDNIPVRDNIIKGFGLKKMTSKEIERNLNILQKHLNEIKNMTDKKFSYTTATVGQSMLPVYNTILSIITNSMGGNKDSNGNSNNKNLSYKDVKVFMENIKKNDVFAIKSDLEGIIVLFKADKSKCDEAVEYARKNSDFDWETDDGVFFGEGLKTFKEKYCYEKERLVQNFTKERYLKVLELYKKYDEEEKSQGR